MKRNSARAWWAFVLVLLLGGCTGTAVGTAGQARSPAPATPLAAAFATSNAAPPCRASALALRFGPELVPMTGEHGGYFALVNHGRTACTLDGYPAVALYDAAGAILPFRYAHQAGGYLTKAPPRAVLLAPGASAYVLVAKYRCDLGVRRDAATMRLTLPGAAAAARAAGVMAIRFASRLPGELDMSYCKGGPGDPGQVVGVSPVEPAPADAGPFAGQ